MSSTTPNLGLFKYNTTADANVAFSITKALNNNWDIIDAKCMSSNNILDFKWSDHLLNDMSWLRADTFSWQDGNTYSLVYNELLSEYNNSTSTTETDGSITFKRTQKGYKIALSNQETAIAEKYATDGIAWYYILDTANKKFKLPRTKFGFEGLRTSVGNDIEAGLPNITGSFRYMQNLNNSFLATGSFNIDNIINMNDANGGTTSAAQVSIDASRSSSVYGNSDTVQSPATQMYLYFYVGAFTKSAEAQTAGLNAELLNGKLDISNIKRYPIEISDKSLMPSWYVVYSDGWCEQGGHCSDSNSYTVTFLKQFINTNYIPMVTFNYCHASYIMNMGCINLTNTSMIIEISDGAQGNDRPVFWQASGYIR